MTNSIPNSPTTIEQKIRALAATDPSIVAAFGGADTFDATLTRIGKIDESFAKTGREFFALGATPKESAERFTRIQIEKYREEARPSLPALVAHHLDDIGLDPTSPHYKAALLVAARAEVTGATTPQYHNKNHYADVTAQLAEFLKLNNVLADKGVPGAQKLSVEEMADSITAAVGHDIDHPGGKNALPGEATTATNRLRLEEQSFAAMKPLLEKAGLSKESIDGIHAMIQTTSPDGPHGILKATAKAQQEGRTVEWETLDPKGQMADLKNLAEQLKNDSKLTARAAMLEDADLGASAFEGLISNVKMSDFFTRELQERKYNENLRGPNARQGFSDFVVGEGPASAAAQAAVGQNYKDMYNATRPIANQLKVLGAGVWQEETDDDSAVPVARAAGTGLSDMQVNNALKAMRELGLNPSVETKDGVSTFRLEGADVATLADMRKEVIAKMDWQPAATADGVTVSRVTAAPLGADEIKALNNALRSEGASPVSNANADIEVSGKDMRLVASFKKALQRKPDMGPANDSGKHASPKPPRRKAFKP
jgi:hypothetical protein